MSIFLWIIGILIFLFLLLGMGSSFYMTRRFQLTEVHTPEEYGLAYETVTFQAADGVRLEGVWVPAPGSDRVVIILHGHGGSMDLDIQRAPYFHQAGFNVLLIDFRAHGRSAGRLATFGYLERQDVLGAVAYIQSRGMHRIGLLGFSYGGMASMLATPLCKVIKAVVSDGGPARMRSAITGRVVELNLPFALGSFLGWLAVAFTSLRLGVDLFKYEPIRWVGRIAPRPILFIHGEQDRYLYDFDDLFAAASNPKEAWRLPGVEHTKASEAKPKEYYQRVIDFFDRTL